MSDIPERDWRVFRELQKVALERFCERVLREIDRIASSEDKSWHQRYGTVFGLIERKDAVLARAFDGPRRSRAMLQLVAIHSESLITQEELERFTPDTQERLRGLAPAANPLGGGKLASNSSSSGHDVSASGADRRRST